MSKVEKWRGKTALITGASAGIGMEMARQLSDVGCNLLISARRRDRLEQLRDEITSAHDVEVVPIVQDLGAADGGRALFEQVAALDRRVDLLINNAGFGISGYFADTDWDREVQMMRLNVFSLVELTKLILPGMLERNSGDILLVSSIAGYVTSPTFAVYSGTKAFVTSFGEALAYELRNTGVRATVLNPGGTTTEFTEVAGYKATRLQRIGSMSAQRVARIGLRAMAKGKRSVVAGWMNAAMIWLTRFIPLGLRLRAALLFQKFAGGGQ